MKIKVKGVIIGVFVLVVILMVVATAYLSVSLASLPISLPFKPSNIEEYEMSNSTESIMNQWYERIIYKPEAPVSIVSIIDSDDVDTEFLSLDKLQAKYRFVDTDSLVEYLELNDYNVASGDFSKIFIDKADKLNTPFGVKAFNGTDTVLALDTIDGITLIGKSLVNEKKGTTTNVKIAIMNNPKLFTTECVKDLNTYTTIDTLYNEAQAILAVNGSNYTYNEGETQAQLYGAYVYEGEVIRRPYNADDVVCVDNYGTLTIGGNIDEAYNVVEALNVLIKNGEVVYNSEDSNRSAITAIGCTTKGELIIIVASGGAYGSNIGATNAEILDIFKEYDAYNAAVISGGTRSIMYWNGRVITDHASDFGVELPNALIIKPKTVTTVVENTEGTSGEADVETITPENQVETVEKQE